MKGTTRKKLQLFFMLAGTGIILFLILILQPLQVIHFRNYIAFLFPTGLIAFEERDLLLIIQGIMLLVIIPVYILTFIFSWRYSAYKPKGKYDPDLVDNRIAEYIWWGVPLRHDPDRRRINMGTKPISWIPINQLTPTQKPMTIQVVALQWKWLFIYPEEKIASSQFSADS